MGKSRDNQRAEQSAATLPITAVSPVMWVRDHYIKHKGLIFSWSELVKRETLGNEIHIETKENAIVFLNGHRLSQRLSKIDRPR